MCNTILFNIPANKHPFDEDGAAHNSKYIESPQVSASHYYQTNIDIRNSNIISIHISHNDLLPLNLVSLIRAGNLNIANITKNTYRKFNNIHYKSLLNNVIRFYTTNDISTYNDIKDKLWPDIQYVSDFDNLPDVISDECINTHHYYPFELTYDKPDCPAYALRDFFKRSFLDPSESGFIKNQEKMTYKENNNVYYFPYIAFYDTQSFIDEIFRVSNFFNINSFNVTNLIALHKQFLQNQPYKNSKSKCDDILSKIYNTEPIDLQGLDILEEAYIEAKVEKHYSITLPFVSKQWFQNTTELHKCLNSL